MKCRFCQEEFDETRFSFCPYCTTSYEVEADSVSNWDRDNTVEEYAPEKSTQEFVYVETCLEGNTNNDEMQIQDGELFIESCMSNSEISNSEESNNLLDLKEVKLQTRIDNIEGFTRRSKNALLKNNIMTAKELIDFISEHDLQQDLRNVGVDSEKNIIQTIEKFMDCDLKKYIHVGNGMDDILSDLDMDNISSGKLNSSLDIVPGFTNRSKRALKRENINTIGELVDFIRNHNLKTELRNVGKDTERNIKETLRDFTLCSISSKDLLKNFLERNLDSKEGKVYLRRINGESLQEIGDNPIDGMGVVSRERIRQVQNKFVNLLKPFVLNYLNEYKNAHDYIVLNELDNVFDNGMFNMVLRTSIPFFDNEYDYYEFAEVCVKKGCYNRCDKIVEEIIKNNIEDYVDLTESADEIDELLSENGLNFITSDGFKNALQKCGYTVNGNVAFKYDGYGKICSRLIKEYFKEGIKLSSRGSITDNDDMMKLRKLLLEKYGIKLKADDGTISAQISRYLVLCGRGFYISPENIYINSSILREIKKYIDESPENKFFDKELFDRFSGVLKAESNIDTPQFLHGALMYYYGDEYKGVNYYILKDDGRDYKTSALEQREELIYQDILTLGRPITRAEIKKRHLGWTDMMITLSLQDSTRIVQWAFNEFFTVDLLEISSSDIEMLRQTLIDEMTKNNGYTNAYLLFDTIRNEHTDFLDKNPHIKNEKNLFYAISNLFQKECDFRSPHVAPKKMFTSLDGNSIVDYLLSNPEKISFDGFYHACKRFKWPESQIRNIFTQYKKQFFQVSKDEYIRIEHLNKPSVNILEEIRENILSIMKHDILFMGADIDYKNFPVVEYEWNEFLLRSIIETYLQDSFRIIDPVITDMRYQRCALVLESSAFNSLDQVVAYIMQQEEKLTVTSSAFLARLRIYGIADGVIPLQFRTSPYITYDKKAETYQFTKKLKDL